MGSTWGKARVSRINTGAQLLPLPSNALPEPILPYDPQSPHPHHPHTHTPTRTCTHITFPHIHVFPHKSLSTPHLLVPPLNPDQRRPAQRVRQEPRTKAAVPVQVIYSNQVSDPSFQPIRSICGLPGFSWLRLAHCSPRLIVAAHPDFSQAPFLTLLPTLLTSLTFSTFFSSSP